MTTSTESETPMSAEYVTIEHSETSQRATVRARAVEGWARAGWQPVQEETGTAPTHFLVLAGTGEQAKAWARQSSTPQRAVTYASGPDAVRGLSTEGLQVVELESFAGHRHEDEIRAALAEAFTPNTQPAPAGTQDDSAAGSSTDDNQE